MAIDKKIKKSIPGKSKKGGKMPGAGRKPGSLNKKTLEEKLIKEEMRQRILRSVQPLLDAQFSLAKGVNLLYYVGKDSKGKNLKPELVTDRYTIEEYLIGALDDSDGYYYITTERPDNKAIDSLLDRTFGKAMQSIDHTSDGEKMDFPTVYLPAEKADE